MSDRETLLDRFCRYVRIDTQSSDTSATYPSTEKQKDLLRILVERPEGRRPGGRRDGRVGLRDGHAAVEHSRTATRRTAGCRSSACSRTWTRTTR